MHILVATDSQGGSAYLTTESVASSYGLPVLQISSIDVEGDFGPGDVIGEAPQLMMAASVIAAWAQQGGRTDEEIDAARKFLRQWPEGPQVE